MDILVLGGTRFVGRHLVERLLGAGHRVSLLHRGRHPSPFEAVETLVGDRDGDLSALAGRSWDAVVDLSGYTAPQVEAVAEVLGGEGRYLFVSTISVYAGPGGGVTAEDGPLHPPDPRAGRVAYGPQKVACEEVVRDRWGGEALVLRPGIIVGPHDYTGRFAYWCLRLREGGPVLVPGPRDRPVQVVDVRDLAAWAVASLEAGTTGTYNVVGPAEPATLAGLLDEVQRGVGGEAERVWAGPEELRAAGLDPGGFPLRSSEDDAWIFRMDGSRALARGLELRPLAGTARDTLRWVEREGEEVARAAGPSLREEERVRRALGSSGGR